MQEEGEKKEEDEEAEGEDGPASNMDAGLLDGNCSHHVWLA
jgi:hypothetical protein